MRAQNTSLAAILAVVFAFSAEASAQSKQYQRKKAASPQAQPATAPAAAGTKSDAKAPAAGGPEVKKDSEKLDISELEQKYWAPKDTDFSVVQNRTYTKAKRYSASLLYGPMVNDPFNSGNNLNFTANYYFDERMGVELMHISSDLKDSKAVDNFRGLSAGGVLPDFNRPIDYTGVGFNFVPFYAKMSFMGKKIIYFDMQATIHAGMSTYEQITENPADGKEESSFSWGIDVTQYFFFSKHVAVRVNYHNRFYDEDVRGYQSGQVVKSGDGANVTNLLMGLTFFF